MSEQVADPVPRTARATLERHFADGWPTPDTSPWLTGGYVTKERLMAVMLLVADYVDRATGHPDARADDPAGDDEGAPRGA